MEADRSLALMITTARDGSRPPGGKRQSSMIVKCVCLIVCHCLVLTSSK